MRSSKKNKPKIKYERICVCNPNTSSCRCFALRERGQSREPAEGSYKGPPQLCQHTGNCCAFSHFHVAPSASFTLSCSRLCCSVTYRQQSPHTRRPLVPVSPFLGDLLILLLPGWASLLDRVRGGVGFLWRSGSLEGGGGLVGVRTAVDSASVPSLFS